MTSKGLFKIHHAIQTYEAWKDWNTLRSQAIESGLKELADQYQPKDGAGWRVIDRQIKMLRKALEAAPGEG